MSTPESPNLPPSKNYCESCLCTTCTAIVPQDGWCDNCAHCAITHGPPAQSHTATDDRDMCAITYYYGESVLRSSQIVEPEGKKEAGPEQEFVWGMKPGAFDVDAPTNTLRLTADLHYAFDNDYWALVPMDHAILAQIEAFYLEWPLNATKDSYPHFKMDDFYKPNQASGKFNFEYAFLPIGRAPDRYEMPILRLDPPLDASSYASPQKCSISYFPYTALQRVSLPIPPHLVIWNLGTKFRKRRLDAGYITDDPTLFGP